MLSDSFSSSQLRLGLMDEGLLEQTGVIRENPEIPRAPALSEPAVSLFMQVAQGGEGGILIASLPKSLKDCWPEFALELELHDLITRERNHQGQVAFLVLTWKGEEALVRAKSHSVRKGQWGARRRASINEDCSVKKRRKAF